MGFDEFLNFSVPAYNGYNSKDYKNTSYCLGNPYRNMVN